MHFRKKFDEKSIKLKFENTSNILDDILSSQIPSSDKYGLEYDKEKTPEYSSFMNQDERSYVVALKKEESKKYAPLIQRTDMIPRRPVTSRYQQILFFPLLLL